MGGGLEGLVEGWADRRGNDHNTFFFPFLFPTPRERFHISRYLASTVFYQDTHILGMNSMGPAWRRYMPSMTHPIVKSPARASAISHLLTDNPSSLDMTQEPNRRDE